MAKNSKKPIPLDRHSRFNEFYSLAFGDYLAARTLLLAELLPQGAGLAATAVEKIFKAILSIRDEKLSGHLKTALLNSIANYQPALFELLNTDFLKFLITAYDLRYLDNFSNGHSIVISKYRTLAEIDHTMCTIFSGMEIRQGAINSQLPFERAKINKNVLLLTENYFIEDGNTSRYFARPNFVQEIKVFGPHESVDATYRTEFVNRNGSFLKPVNLVKTENGLTGQFSGG